MEKWKPILGYEGIYEVSNKGKVRSSKDKTTSSVLRGERKWKQRILRLKTDKNGYKRVTLWKNKTRKDFLVHRLVALTFITEVNGKNNINHIDGNPSNNYVENLEWCNHKENLIHAFKKGLNKSPDPIVLLNINTHETKYFYSKAEASRFLNRNHGFISRLVKEGLSEVDEYMIFVKPF
ncbi:HNH endonuclease [Marinilactibacillus sp. 15R]|uniref:NUMOD4 domain-containing protein n=1 Tax=Marinilactibacillus sp. 15R TaxID=1911586 RepID=UPI00090983E5|nr:NUMOD4 domain-containing protein [Marinilactibacillus sp. 15R]API89403.1 HNH endonuclease [Marinilactibacillus sp. 15R]